MTQLLLSKNAVMLYEILIILVLILIQVRQSKKRREIQERREVNNTKLRNTQLEERLKNPDIDPEWSQNPNPFDVQYVHEAKIDIKALPKFQVEIEVHTDISVQRYLFDLDREVSIGRDEKNILPLKDPQAAPKCCSIFVKNQAVYVRDENAGGAVFIQRGKNRMAIQNQMVKLQNKDILKIGKTSLHVSIYKN